MQKPTDLSFMPSPKALQRFIMAQITNFLSENMQFYVDFLQGASYNNLVEIMQSDLLITA
jgi:hypothetical protein